MQLAIVQLAIAQPAIVQPAIVQDTIVQNTIVQNAIVLVIVAGAFLFACRYVRRQLAGTGGCGCAGGGGGCKRGRGNGLKQTPLVSLHVESSEHGDQDESTPGGPRG